MNQRRMARYLIFLFVGGLLIWSRELLIREYMERFELKPIQWVSFVSLFGLGAMLACLPKDVFQKKNWRFKFKVDLFVFFLVFVLLGTTYIHTWRFVLEIFMRVNRSQGTILNLSQLMSGFIFLQFFLVTEEDN